MPINKRDTQLQIHKLYSRKIRYSVWLRSWWYTCDLDFLYRGCLMPSCRWAGPKLPTSLSLRSPSSMLKWRMWSSVEKLLRSSSSSSSLNLKTMQRFVFTTKKWVDMTRAFRWFFCTRTFAVRICCSLDHLVPRNRCHRLWCHGPDC